VDPKKERDRTEGPIRKADPMMREFGRRPIDASSMMKGRLIHGVTAPWIHRWMWRRLHIRFPLSGSTGKT
jgi:hypothetical protein